MIRIFSGPYDDSIGPPALDLEGTACFVLFLEDYSVSFDEDVYKAGLYQNETFLGNVDGHTMAVGVFTPRQGGDRASVVGVIDTGQIRIFIETRSQADIISERMVSRLRASKASHCLAIGGLHAFMDESDMTGRQHENVYPVKVLRRGQFSRNPTRYGEFVPEGEEGEPKFRFGARNTFAELEVRV